MHRECVRCDLHKVAARLVFAGGDPDSGIVFVGEAPGPDEDREGSPFVGRAGKELAKHLAAIGLTRENVYLTNVVKCFPNVTGMIRKPTGDEIAVCTRRWLFPELRRLRIDVLVCVGAVAAETILGETRAMTTLHGKWFKSEWCENTIVIFHPSFLLRKQGNPHFDKVMRKAFAAIDELLQLRGKRVGASDDGAVNRGADLGAGSSDLSQIGEGPADGTTVSTRKKLLDLYASPEMARQQADQQPAAGRMAKDIIEEPSRSADAVYADLEQRIITATSWADILRKEGVENPERKYIGAFSDNADVVLIFRRPDGTRVRERILHDWYFYMRTEDVLKVPPSFWREWRAKSVFKKLEPDDVAPDRWVKVYARREVVQTQWMKDRGEIGIAIGGFGMAAAGGFGKGSGLGHGGVGLGIGMDNAAQHRDSRVFAIFNDTYKKYESDRLLHDFLEALHTDYGWSYEADLTPRQRFMTDHFLEIQDQYNELYIDIETDDSIPGWEQKESWRFLSMAIIHVSANGTVSRDSWVIDDETDEAERRMLEAFHVWLPKTDILYAWNGFNFDFKILRSRLRRYGMDYDWRNIVWCDLLAVWRRYHYRGASAITSFALGELAPKALGEAKVDWRAMTEQRGKRLNKIIELYREYPDLLRAYNEKDVDLLYKLEQRMGYARIERVFCRLGNCFANDFNVSTKVDMLLLNKGRMLGEHFYTRGVANVALPDYIKDEQSIAVKQIGAAGELIETKGKQGDKVEYTGAFVFEPKVGYHENVAALDFKSLYPTVMTLFNISPETWVSKKDVDCRQDDAGRYACTWRQHPDVELIHSPSRAHFRKEQTGLIPLVFRETMEKRKTYTKLQLGETIGSLQFLHYYRLSYAYKRLGLSFYGELGNETARFFNPEVAEAVTLAGQWLIKKTIAYAEEHGYSTLYGDTDSLYTAMSKEQADAFVKQCDAHYREIVRVFNVDMDRFMLELEYENQFKNIIFVKKKRYAGQMTQFKGKASDYLEVKGLECMRSDGTELGRQFQRDVLGCVLNGNRPDVKAVIKVVTAQRDKIFAFDVAGDDIVITQAIEKSVEEYKTMPPHVRVAKHIREVSTEYFVGMKVPYVITAHKPKLEAVWAAEYNGRYDPVYYWNTKIYPLVHRVLEVVYPAFDWDRFYAEEPVVPRRTAASKRRVTVRSTGPIK